MTGNANPKTAGALALALWLKRERPPTDTYKDLFGVAVSTVYRWTQGEVRPNYARRCRIAEVTFGFVLADHWMTPREVETARRFGARSNGGS
jgi:hypothetical protein